MMANATHTPGPWHFECGEDEDPDFGPQPFRTIWGPPGYEPEQHGDTHYSPETRDGNDCLPLADLADEACDEDGLLMAAAPEMRAMLGSLWSVIDAARSRDARRTRFLNAIHDEMGALLRQLPFAPGERLKPALSARINAEGCLELEASGG